MRQPASLALLYLALVALVLPASPFAADDVTSTTPRDTTLTETTPTETTATTQQPPAPEPPAPVPPSTTTAPAPPEPVAAKQPKARKATPGTVTIKDFSFGPGSITVNAGESVTWTNNGPTKHSATANDGSFDTGLLAKGKSASHTFSKAGSFAYVCSIHPNMHGTVRVVAASAGTQQSQSGGTSSSSTAPSSSSSSSSNSSSADSGGSTLPKTGVDAGALALLGALMLGAGVAARRRTHSG
jgi:LPXTG-motif cell wall-anchored protein